MSFYSDEKIKKNIEKRRREEAYKKEQERKEKEKLEKLKIKESRYKVEEIPLPMVLSICFLISIMGISFKSNLLYVLYSIIGIVVTIFVGKRTKYKFDNTLNILLWNISIAINDFIKFKLKIDNSYETNKKTLNMYSIFFIICLLLLNSTNILYGISFILIIFIILLTIGNKNFDLISEVSYKIALFSFVGLITKTILYSIIYQSLNIDFMNIIMVDLFGSIYAYTKDLEIYKP